MDRLALPELPIDPGLAFAAVIAVAIALLTWSLAEIGAAALAQYRTRFTATARVNLRDLFLFVDPSRLFALNTGGLLLVAALAWLVTGSLVTALLLGAAAASVPTLAFRWMRARRLQLLEEQLPDALLVLAGGLKAGVSLTAALAQLTREARPPVSQEFDLVLREQRLGVPLDEAFDNLARRVPTQSITLIVAAMRIATQTGGGLAETLERASQTIRAKLAMEGKIRALTAQGKLQAVVVGLLPFFLAFVLMRMEPEAMAMLWTTRIGIATIVVVLLLQFCGVMLIRKIVAIDV